MPRVNIVVSLFTSMNSKEARFEVVVPMQVVPRVGDHISLVHSTPHQLVDLEVNYVLHMPTDVYDPTDTHIEVGIDLPFLDDAKYDLLKPLVEEWHRTTSERHQARVLAKDQGYMWAWEVGFHGGVYGKDPKIDASGITSTFIQANDAVRDQLIRMDDLPVSDEMIWQSIRPITPRFV